jgi:hypothetical protein
MIERDSARGRPFLATLAVRRTGTTSELPGRYCAQQDLWVVDGPNGPIPIVMSHQEDPLPELVTKTDEIRERDDPSPSLLLELSTKTETKRERDD